MTKPAYSEIPQPMDADTAVTAPPNKQREVIVIGGGMAGLSASIYLGRALRDVLVIDAGESLARWEPDVQNYFGFAHISGEELIKRGHEQAKHYGVEFAKDEIIEAHSEDGVFRLKSKEHTYSARRLLLATGVYHLPPRIPEVDACIGHSMFFCKDCDGYRVQDRQVLIVGTNDVAVEYALGILLYTASVTIATNGGTPNWSPQHDAWVKEYKVPVYLEPITAVEHEKGCMNCIQFGADKRITVDFLFTTRGDVFHNKLARSLGAELDEEGQLVVDHCQRTSVPGFYAAGCVTPANCQMIIAAGNGATAAQAINRDLFEESLATHSLRRHREKQLRTEQTDLQPAPR